MTFLKACGLSRRRPSVLQESGEDKRFAGAPGNAGAASPYTQRSQPCERISAPFERPLPFRGCRQFKQRVGLQECIVARSQCGWRRAGACLRPRQTARHGVRTTQA